MTNTTERADHPYKQSDWSMGDACVQLVMRDGGGDQCGLPRAQHPPEHGCPHCGIDGWECLGWQVHPNIRKHCCNFCEARGYQTTHGISDS